ncbi:MAG: HAD family phosphatase [Simkania sp.]|nr:HAD family phosphatase [Simkania sp.]
MYFRKFFLTLMTSSALFATSNTVLFDFGGVMTGEPNRVLVMNFLCESLELMPSEFEKANLEKRQAFLEHGINDLQFWLEYASKHNISLPKEWEQEFKVVLKNAIGINDEMYALVEELKSKKIPVALLSNIDKRLSTILRELDLYYPFEPCLLSCDIGAEKPDLRAYEVALNHLNTPAHQIVFFDDREENIEAAKQAGLDAILFESAAQAREELAKRNLL